MLVIFYALILTALVCLVSCSSTNAVDKIADEYCDCINRQESQSDIRDCDSVAYSSINFIMKSKRDEAVKMGFTDDSIRSFIYSFHLDFVEKSKRCK